MIRAEPARDFETIRLDVASDDYCCTEDTHGDLDRARPNPPHPSTTIPHPGFTSAMLFSARQGTIVMFVAAATAPPANRVFSELLPGTRTKTVIRALTYTV